MSEVTLIRHGQAQSGAADEASYDRLSGGGTQQARWLAEYLAASAFGYDRIVAGPLRRQQGTAVIVGELLGIHVETDPRLKEFDYFGLARSMEASHALPFPSDRASYMTHMPQVIAAWQSGEISSRLESYKAFETRVTAALEDAEATGARTLLITSGGVIGTALRLILSLDTRAYAHLLLQIHNASMHRYVVEAGARMLETFNATPHLDVPNRAALRTFV